MVVPLSNYPDSLVWDGIRDGILSECPDFDDQRLMRCMLQSKGCLSILEIRVGCEDYRCILE